MSGKAYDGTDIMRGNEDRAAGLPPKSATYFYLYGYMIDQSSSIQSGKNAGRTDSYVVYIMEMCDPLTVPHAVRSAHPEV